MLMVLGVTLVRIGPRPVPHSGLSMPPWQTLVGFAMCVISAGWGLWLRSSPYSDDPDSTDPDALTTLNLNAGSMNRSEPFTPERLR